MFTWIFPLECCDQKENRLRPIAITSDPAIWGCVGDSSSSSRLRSLSDPPSLFDSYWCVHFRILREGHGHRRRKKVGRGQSQSPPIPWPFRARCQDARLRVWPIPNCIIINVQLPSGGSTKVTLKLNGRNDLCKLDPQPTFDQKFWVFKDLLYLYYLWLPLAHGREAYKQEERERGAEVVIEYLYLRCNKSCFCLDV